MNRTPLLLCVLPLSACTGLSYYDGTADKTGTDTAETTDPGDDDDTPGDDDDTPGDDDDTPGDDDDTTSPGDDDDTTTTDTTTTDTTTAGDDDDDTTTTDTTGTITDTGTPPPPPLSLLSVTPAFGSNVGGTEVTLSGQFSAGTSVLFGGLPATVLSTSATEITALAPATASTGWVDVGVSFGADTAILPSAFQYWQDGTGQSGSFGVLSYVEFVGGYWASTTPIAYGLFTFTEPGSWEIWQDYTSSMETCVYNYAAAALPASYDPGAAYIDLDNAGATTRLNDASAFFGTGFYGDDVLSPGVDVVPGASYDLLAVSGGPNWPSFDVPGFVEVPPSFDVTTPNLDRANAPNTDSQIELVWTGSGGDYMLVYILRQYWSGTAWIDDGVVTCAVYDDGSFTVPSTVWPAWFVGDFLHIQVARVYQSSAVLPHNNTDNRATGLYWYYGGADSI